MPSASDGYAIAPSASDGYAIAMPSSSCNVLHWACTSSMPYSFHLQVFPAPETPVAQPRLSLERSGTPVVPLSTPAAHTPKPIVT